MSPLMRAAQAENAAVGGVPHPIWGRPLTAIQQDGSTLLAGSIIERRRQFIPDTGGLLL